MAKMLHADICWYNRKQIEKKIKVAWCFAQGSESGAVEDCLSIFGWSSIWPICVTKQVILVLPVLAKVLSADILFISQLTKNEKLWDQKQYFI